MTEASGLVSETMFPPPESVYSAFIDNQELIVDNTWPTVTAGFIGFGLAVVTATLSAILLSLSKRVENALMPLVVSVNSVPRVTLAPLLIFYLGSGVATNYMIAAWVAFFPMFLNAMESLGQISGEHHDLCHLYQASTWQEYRYIRIPNALPQMFDGMKMAIILAMIGAVVGEFVATTEGLGYLSTLALRNANMGLAFAVVGVLGFISTAAIFVLYQIQDKLIFWEDSSFFTTEA
ncbi:ABC transporter permease [Halegenticoccus tardaugens]|uniref:ABC transporter permease n=1 Tax=Halegenticoccus tardaugens TaxID=2071624 RepID=UPI0013E91D61|nr:ABC transporter permease [Halegenticoccus tardaugens]